MFFRKVFVFLIISIFTCVSVFGQDVAAVKEFERARRTIPISITLNIFGFGIGSFIQGDYKNAFIQLGVSTVGYALLLSGIFGNFTASDGRTWSHNNSTIHDAKYALIGIGSALVAGNLIFGSIRPVLYQFDQKFDVFYDPNNEIKWPGGF